jgi:hypothetical protein
MPTVTIGDQAGATYTGCEATYIDAGAPTTNSGTASAISVYSFQKHSLLRFTGLSNITGPVSVSAATLYVNAEWIAAGTGNNTLDTYKCLRSWVETEATWNVYATGSSWATAGGRGTGDVNAGASASNVLTTSYPAYKALTSAQLAADVEGWINSGSNNGWLVIHNQDGVDNGSQFDFSSDDNATTTIRPYLEITYSEQTQTRGVLKRSTDSIAPALGVGGGGFA